MFGIPVILADVTETVSTIADKVRGVASEKRFTQERVARVLGIARNSVAERYAGRVPYTGAELHTLSEAMGVPVHRFFPDPAKRS